MNYMKVRSKGSFFIAMLLILSFFTSFAILEVNALCLKDSNGVCTDFEVDIPVSAKGFENTIIIEFENGEQNTVKIKTINIWLAKGNSFQVVKQELGWNSKPYGDGQGLTFSTSEVLNPGESVKFGVVTAKKVNAINWKIIDENQNQIGPEKTKIVEISQTPIIVKSTDVEVDNVQQTGDILYGTKKFIPDNLRTGSNMRLVGNGFSSEQTLQFYLNDKFLKSTESDAQGNFITTIKIPDSIGTGISKFKIVDELGSSQISSVKINEQQNRLIKEGQVIQEFKINNMPESVTLDDTLSISGVGHPSKPVLITIKNEDVIETIQVIDIGVNGEWNFQKSITTDDELGDRTIIIRNDFNETSRDISIVTGQLFTISVFTATTDLGDVFVLTGTALPNEDLSLLIKNPDDDTIRFDILKIDESGEIKYEFPNSEYEDGTYVLKATQNNVTQVSLFTLGTTSYDRVVVYLEKMNFKANSTSKLTILGPPSTNLTLNIFDPSDNRKFTESIKTNSIGTKTFEFDLTGYSSGVYKAVISNPTYQDTAKFSVGLSAGSGAINFSSTQTEYSPGESVLIIGNTGANSLLNIFLIDPNGEIIYKGEIFTDKEGGFTTEMLGIPSNAESGIWQIQAQSGLDHKEMEITVSDNNS
uniref:Uncharacterized protein n=1 Tax=uncultured marine thaumarchaeote SAT1000_48_C08 TaxID=1456415 RepID=A0A075IBD1_9ARCH|nr:hypothetical protein [uncultured marine thaumarchaeote SAT1000_48_C08]